MVLSKFHFEEIDWVIFFPNSGNEGRPYQRYGVAYRDRVRGISQPGVRINLDDVMIMPSMRNNYPHTVHYYLDSIGRGNNWRPQYLETRSIASLEKFFQFLNDLHR